MTTNATKEDIEKRVEAVKEFAKAGRKITVRNIADKLGLTYEQARVAIRAAGVKTEQAYLIERTKAIIELVHQNPLKYTYADICGMFGLSLCTAHQMAATKKFQHLVKKKNTSPKKTASTQPTIKGFSTQMHAALTIMRVPDFSGMSNIKSGVRS